MKTKEITERVKKTIKENSLIMPGEKVLCALSGGSDSVMMTHILSRLSGEMGFSVFAAHINHGIRAEADEDEEFAKRFCSGLLIRLFIKHADIPRLSRETKISEELCGRNVRYEFFSLLCSEHGIDKIATAHNRNDSAESVLLHLIRGAGPDGMAGIPVKRDNIIRPIINISKEEVIEYCRENSLSYVTDKTNFSDDYTRNKIRNGLIPYIEKEFNPGFLQTLIRNGEVFSQISDYMTAETKKLFIRAKREYGLDIDILAAAHPALSRSCINMLFKEYLNTHENLSVIYINAVYDLIKNNASQKTVNLPKGISARIEYGKLFFEKTAGKALGYKYFPVLGEPLFIKEADMEIVVLKEDVLGKNTKRKIYFYLNDTKNICIRSRSPGDSFCPSGMEGRKKLSDLFTDKKIPSALRDKIPVLEKDGKIIWVCGIRKSREFENGKILMSCEITRGEIN